MRSRLKQNEDIVRLTTLVYATGCHQQWILAKSSSQMLEAKPPKYQEGHWPMPLMGVHPRIAPRNLIRATSWAWEASSDRTLTKGTMPMFIQSFILSKFWALRSQQELTPPGFEMSWDPCVFTPLKDLKPFCVRHPFQLGFTSAAPPSSVPNPRAHHQHLKRLSQPDRCRGRWVGYRASGLMPLLPVDTKKDW